MDFKNVDKKYRPIPFWSWNERLDTATTREQVALMDEAGIGGYFMHARGGLLTEYMGEEWFDNIHAAADEGKSRGMYSWAYDENGWPSGFGGGLVNGLGDAYRQKSLHVEPVTEGAEALPNTLLVRDGKRYYYLINEFYVDVLDKKVIAEFIDKIYATYKEKCGDSIEGFFTDEPQIYRGTGFPWSFILEEEFASAYGYSLVDNLDALFNNKDNSTRVRLDYWQLVTRLFSEAYSKQVGDWCVANGYQLTGHMVLEESLYSQLVTNGSCMAQYEYYTIPGMDWLCRPVFDCLTPMQVSSVAQQMGIKQVLSETFAASGDNVSHNELKRIFEWQMVHGINLLCTHLEGYSLRGIRKRDYPVAMYYQQPWWEQMHIFFDSMSRIGKLLAEGEPVVDVLLMHPMSTAWQLYDGMEPSADCRAKLDYYNDALLRDMRVIEDKHICYHLGDETVIRRHGRVENGKFIIGKMSYSTLVIPENLGFLPYTDSLIEQFRAQGGRVLRPEELEANPITAESRLSYTTRRFDGFTLHYFVNTDDCELTAHIARGNKRMDPIDGELYPFFGTHTFAPYESLVLIEDGEREAIAPSAELAELDLGGQWQVTGFTPNSLTLDKCDYYFDGELVERDGYVLNILPRLNELRRKVALRQDYRFTCEYIPEDACLVTETPELFTILVNGVEVEKTDVGFFRDSAFRMIPIGKYLRLGKNEITLNSEIEQSPECYEHLSKSWTFESMKNCLSYDREIEAIRIAGSFGLRLPDRVEELRRDAYRISEQPVIVAPPTSVDVAHLDRDGFSQFAGKLTLTKRVTVDSVNYYAMPVGRGMNAVGLSVNGGREQVRMFAPYELDLSDKLTVGENTLTLTIWNNLRNLMGPHHVKDGEVYAVPPRVFFKESCVFAHARGVGESCHDVMPHWNEDYCFVHFGLGRREPSAEDGGNDSL